jgi:hypothetical protein
LYQEESDLLNAYYFMPIYLSDLITTNDDKEIKLFGSSVYIESQLKLDQKNFRNKDLYNSDSSRYIRSLEEKDKLYLLIQMIKFFSSKDVDFSKNAERNYFRSTFSKEQIVNSVL